jgi:hypothetical protein
LAHSNFLGKRGELIQIDPVNFKYFGGEFMRVEPLFGRSQIIPDPDLCFVLMPFSSHLTPVFTDHIRSVCNQLNIKCLRADDIFSNSAIIEDIWCSINKARVIIADLTSKNPNVFYEIGIAHTIGKSVILITQDIGDIPFDLRHLRHIIYQFTPRGMEKFESALYNTIQHIIAEPVISIEQFKCDLVSDLSPEIGSLNSYPDEYVKKFIFDRLNETFLRKNALELCFLRNSVDNNFLDTLLKEKNPVLKASISGLIEKYAMPVSEDIIISLLSEESLVANPTLKAVYRLCVNGHFSSKIFETTSNNSTWSVRKNAVLKIIELNDLHSLDVLSNFINPDYDPEYHETIMSVRNYIESLIAEKRLRKSDIVVAIKFVDHHVNNAKLSPNNKELLTNTYNKLLDLSK